MTLSLEIESEETPIIGYEKLTFQFTFTDPCYLNTFTHVKYCSHTFSRKMQHPNVLKITVKQCY